MYSMQLTVMLSMLILHNKNVKALEEISACQNKYVLLGTSQNEANVIEVSLGFTVYLKCDYCDGNTVLDDKIWFFKQRGKHDLIEIVKKNYPQYYNLWIEDDHTLQLINFGINDSGIYICKGRNAEENDTMFTYVLDGTIPENTFYAGTLSQWKDYKNTLLDPINEMFERSKDEPFSKFKKDFKFSFRLFTMWENWGPCINNNNTMVRYKIGKCFLYPIPNNSSSNVGNEIKNINDYYLTENYDVSCHSIKLYETLPFISQIVKNIPQYKAVEDCKEIHNIAAVYVPVENNMKLEKNNDYVYTTIKQIAENGHITLICPDLTPDSDVQWFKDNKLLGPSFRNNMAETEDEPHLTIDSYNSLYILHATKKEEGIYTCFVDGKKVENLTLRIVSKSKLLNDEFVRYSIYLSFVLTISLVCYCTGICVAWNRRSSFADPLNLLGK